MTADRVVRHLVLDSEAVHALLARRAHDPRRAAVVEALMAANGSVAVPTAVRAEAGWRRGDPAASANRLVTADVALDAAAADRAVELRRCVPGASVVDAAAGVAAEQLGSGGGGVVELLTSDVEEMSALAGHLDARAVVVGLG